MPSAEARSSGASLALFAPHKHPERLFFLKGKGFCLADLTMNERSFIFPNLCPNIRQIQFQIGVPRSSMQPLFASPNAGFTKPACTTLVLRRGSASD